MVKNGYMIVVVEELIAAEKFKNIFQPLWMPLFRDITLTGQNLGFQSFTSGLCSSYHAHQPVEEQTAYLWQHAAV